MALWQPLMEAGPMYSAHCKLARARHHHVLLEPRPVLFSICWPFDSALQLML